MPYHFKWPFEEAGNDELQLSLRWYDYWAYLAEYWEIACAWIQKKNNLDAHTEIPILKRVSLILIWLKLMFSQEAMCGSVGACRAGNPEEGGSSWVGGKVVCWWKCEFGGYVRLGTRDWEGAVSFF